MHFQPHSQPAEISNNFRMILPSCVFFFKGISNSQIIVQFYEQLHAVHLRNELSYKILKLKYSKLYNIPSKSQSNFKKINDKIISKIDEFSQCVFSMKINRSELNYQLISRKLTEFSLDIML